MLIPIRYITLLVCFVIPITTPVAAGAPLATSKPPDERRIHINPPGANGSRYVYVPFDVPPHAVRVSVSYEYDRANGTNTIDIGLFDARSTGSDTDPRGFRGWSGGRRSEFSVSRDEATPGYLKGDLPPGKWRIILGLYRVAPAGVDISFKIDIETGNKSAKLETNITSTSISRTPVTRQDVSGPGMTWWSGDLHMHTVHSDGNWTVAELIASARNSGLDFIVITDHNTASHHQEIDRLSKGSRQPLVLRGEEITTYGGHTNAWGLPAGAWVDFRTRPGDNSRISNIVAAAHRAGALISINHPFALCGGCAWSYDAGARGFDAIEIWNGPWDATDEPALKMWDSILRSGRRITAIASSDSHRPDTPIGKPSTHVAAKVLSQAALLIAIRDGHAYLTDGTRKLVINFEAEAVTGKRPLRWTIGDEARLSAPGTIRFLIATEAVPPGASISLISNGQVVRSFSPRADNKPEVIEIKCQEDSYFRLEIRDQAKNVVALTNPIYVRVR